jgi:thiamine biosynthesis lipoprotein
MHPELFNFTFNAMGSPCQLQFYALTAPQATAVYSLVRQRIEELEQRYSRYREDSLLSKINRAAGTGEPVLIDPETFALLNYAEHCYRESQQLFDVTSGVLRRLWHAQRTELPTKLQLRELLSLMGWKKVQWNAQQIYLPLAGMELDFGGIVKEYAADVAANLCQQQGIISGVVELGGDVRVIGALPNGQGWPVAIRDPRQPEKIVAQLQLKAGALASSGDYERFQVIDGVRYSHLLNPKTGFPVTGLRAVSVVAEQCVVAGSLATIAMLKGKTGLAWLQQLKMKFLCCQNDGQIIKHLN